jgi:hypothetical protein
MIVETTPNLSLLRRTVRLEKRKAELRKDQAIFFYEPHPKQVLFHSAAGFHYRYGRTGNRFGKSEMGGVEDVSYAKGFRPWLDENDPLRTLGIPKYPTKGLIVCIDWDKSEEAFTSFETGKLWKYIPKNDILGYEKNHSGAIDLIKVRHKTGGTSTIHLDTVKSFKQNPLGQETSVGLDSLTRTTRRECKSQHPWSYRPRWPRLVHLHSARTTLD